MISTLHWRRPSMAWQKGWKYQQWSSVAHATDQDLSKDPVHGSSNIHVKLALCVVVIGVRQARAISFSIFRRVSRREPSSALWASEAGLRGGTKGNLYVLVSIRKHLQFERDGADLKLSWPISSRQAERGDNINIPLIEGGMISLSAPAGTSINNVFRVPEKGMTILRSEKRGDMYVRFAIGVALPPQRKTGQIKLNDPAAFAGMRKAGRLVAECLDMLTKEIVPGVSGEKLDRRVVQFALDHGALPALLNYRGYTCASCISINHVVCHGVPNSLELREGDILSVCTAFAVDGWNARSTRMFTVGAVPARVERLVAVAYEAMMRGVSVVKPGVTTGDIGNAIQSFVESHHMSVVRDYCGSGIGRTLHDDPQIV